MTENILPITQDISIPQQPNPELTNSFIPPQKPKLPILSLVLIMILSVLSVFCIYLFLQVRELSINQPAPSPSPTPISSSDPTLNWEVYQNQKFDFSFKYPQDFKIYDSIDQVGDRLIIQNFNTEIGRTIEPTDYQMIIALGLNGGRKLEWYATNATKELGEFPVEHIVIGGIDAIKGKSGQKQVSVPTIWVVTGEFVYTIQLPTSLPESEKIFDQILSTFKFSDDTTQVDSSWQTYTNPTIGYSIQYPSGWRTQEWEGGIGFGPKEIGEDVILGISYYSKESSKSPDFIDEIGSQFTDRVVKSDSIIVNKTKVGRIVVTTPSIPTWYSESIIFETDKNYIVVGNGAVKDENLPFSRGVPNDFTFAKFYQTFKFTP